MEAVKDSTPHGWSSHQLSESTESAMPQSPATTSNLTNSDTLTPLAGPTSWLQTYSRLGYPSMIPDQPSIDRTQPQQERFGFLPRDRSPSSYPSYQTLPQATVPNAAVGGKQKSQADNDGAPRPERKNTKRRRTGPDRFGNYLHGDVALPLDTTTADVFKKYPNHITDEDIEECWRLGLSARQISELMPEDTHFNSEGVLVQQHHSLIQKKFKTFKLRHGTRVQAMNDDAVQQERQDLPGPSSRRETRTHEKRHRNSTTGSDAPSTVDEMVKVPDLKFRCYPFNPANDQAFEARVSVELVKIAPMNGLLAHEDHEIQVLDLLVRREIQKHGDLLKCQFVQYQTFTSGTDPNVRSGTEDRFHHQQLLSYIDYQRSTLYADISRDLSGQWAIPWFVTSSTDTASEALRKLQLVIDQIYLRYSTNAASPSAKRPIFNFEHTNLRRWRNLARLLYYLISITLKLEAGTSAEDAGTAPESSLNPPRPFGETRARYRDQTMNLSDAAHGLLGGLPLRGELMSTTLHNSPATVAYQQSFNAMNGQAAGYAPAIRPQGPSHFASPSPSTTHVMPSIPAGATLGRASAGSALTQMRSPYHPPIVAAAIRDQFDQNDTSSASAGAICEQATSGAYTGLFATSLLSPRTPRHPTLLSSVMNLPIEPSVSPAHLSSALRPEIDQNVPRDTPSEMGTRPTDLKIDTHGVGLPQDPKQDALSPIRPPQTPTLPTRSLQPDIPAAAYSHVSEIDDYISFPTHGNESEDYTAEMFDWDEWDAPFLNRTESSNSAN